MTDLSVCFVNYYIYTKLMAGLCEYYYRVVTKTMINSWSVIHGAISQRKERFFLSL